MALEVGEEADRIRATPEQVVLRERADELREWLLHLEGWVELQMAATRALVALLEDSRESLNRRSPGRAGRRAG